MRAFLAAVCLLCACENGSTLAHPELFPEADASVDAAPVRMMDARVTPPADAFVDRAPTPDARVEADGAVTPGWVVDVEGLSCAEPSSMCQFEPAAADFTGESPLGPVKISKIGLVYYTGFGAGTELSLSGTAGGRPILLLARVDTADLTQHPQRPLCAPGQYDSRLPAGTGHSLSNTLIYCGKTRSLEQVVLTVDTHQSQQNEPVVVGDTPVTMLATLRVAGDGWSLQVPIQLSRNCGSWILD